MPLRSQVHVDELLSNVSIKHRNENYNAFNIFPEVAVKNSSDVYRVYNRDFRIPETKRASKAEAREHTFYVSTATYVCEEHGLKDHVGDSEARNYDVSDLRAETTMELTNKILLRLERTVARLFTTTAWSQSLSLAAAANWTDTTTSNPISHFDTGSVQIVQNSGMFPNYLLFGHDSWNGFKNNANVLDRIKYTSKDVDQNIAAGLIGVKDVYMSYSVEDTAPQDATATSISGLWADKAFLGYKPPSPGLLQPSTGYIFRVNVPMVKRWRVEERAAEAIEVNMEYSAKVISSFCGFLINNTVS
jgi:hypothetical protein